MRMGAVNHVMNNAVTLAMTLGDPDKADQAFRLSVFNKMPSRFIRPVGSQYQKVFTQQGRRNANLLLLDIKSKLANQIVRLTSTDDDLVLFAKRRSETCSKILARSPSLNDAYRSINRVVKSFGLPPVSAEGKYSLYGAVMRMVDEKWWRRAIRKKHGRNSESLAIKIGLVSKRTGIYASNEALSRRVEQKARTSQMLEEMEAVNELDQAYTLKELQDLSVSNPAIRRAELMTRIAGFEEYAINNGHVGEFITITCPSSMHARLSLSGDQNPKYDGITPDKSQQYLNQQWSKCRAAFKREEIHLYGMRVAEPQQDGTPHWHLLLFMEPEQVKAAIKIMRHYSLEIDGDEKGAQKHRFTAKSIDWSKGTAAGYIAKYISKNIDGHGVDKDLFGNDAEKSSLRVDAWASTWGIRQFQQIGGPPVTTWRILRQLSEAPKEGIVSLAFQAADQGNWCQYMEIMGGHSVLRKEWPIGLAKKNIEELNSYGEPKGQVIVGIYADQVIYESKSHIWNIRPKSESNVTYIENCYVDITLHYVTGMTSDAYIDNLYIDGDSRSDFENEAPNNSAPLEFCQ